MVSGGFDSHTLPPCAMLWRGTPDQIMTVKLPNIPLWGARLKAQLIGLVALNSYFWAPIGKYACIPVLNCYACSLATTACPIGTITAFALLREIPYYVIGTLGMIGVAAGRLFCGWACPFGLVQDLLYRIRSPKWRLPRGANALKYALLVVLVIAVPIALGGGAQKTGADRVVKQSTGAADYCALVCPAGTLEAGVPGLVINKKIREDMSWRSWLKLGLLAAVLGLMVVSRRSFCRTLCPLGAAMALTSRASFLHLSTDQDRCTRCMACVSACPTCARTVPDGTRPKEATAECVLCLECVRGCPESEALCAKLGAKIVMTSNSHPAPAAHEGAISA
ncbi:MAG: 4Fe-4S binding protein [Armatimonadota bacterium]